MRAELCIGLHRAGNGEVVARGGLAVPPYWCRWDGHTLWLVGSAATPVGDDDITLDLHVDDGVTATVRSVAATVAYAARGAGTQLHTRLRVGAGATLRWQPEPVIVTARAAHRATTTVDVARGGALLADEIVVLGRSDERGGRFTAELDLRREGEPVAHTSFDTATPGWEGPGGTAGAKVVATRVVVDPLDDLRGEPPEPQVTRGSVVLRPDGGGAIVTALAQDPRTASELLDAALVLGVG